MPRRRPGGTLCAMTFRPEAMRGAPAGGGVPAGAIDYRLARNAVLSEFRKGRLRRVDVCDAHPELVRASRNVGQGTDIECPVCGQADVVMVSYVFGPRLPAHGRCITTPAEMAKLARRATPMACYVVEVCPECSWNHLARSFPLGGRRTATS